ncbi:hypothetical protein EVAR_43124_1 [Eumeta japonica]|uniref:Uncharacterized protein n=1 Tax=Eumeta variegata TaxID=151549 RepID=A0A4C1XS53_EUMVA|nr:hypothetical protein EVAR_43124_1 [Eumeta japonica]
MIRIEIGSGRDRVKIESETRFQIMNASEATILNEDWIGGEYETEIEMGSRTKTKSGRGPESGSMLKETSLTIKNEGIRFTITQTKPRAKRCSEEDQDQHRSKIGFASRTDIRTESVNEIILH